MKKKTKKFINLDSSTKDKIKGFEDLASQLMEDQVVKGTKISKEKVDDTFELYQFLESEEKRVDKVSSLLTKKLDNLKKHSQEEILFEKHSSKLAHTKEKLLFKLLNQDSHINSHIGEMFRRIF